MFCSSFLISSTCFISPPASCSFVAPFTIVGRHAASLSALGQPKHSGMSKPETKTMKA
jgi:hypothetical protein